MDTGASGADDVNELRRQLEEERTRRRSLETVAETERKGRIAAERKHMSAAEQNILQAQDACEGQIVALDNEAAALEDRYAELADQPGNGKELAKISRRQGEIAAELNTAKQKKTWLEGQRAQFKKTDAAPTTTAASGKVLANGAPIENFGPRTQAFMERHPKVFTDTAYLQRAIAAANSAIADGHADESDEYFDAIAQKLEGKPATTAPAARQNDDDGEEIVTDRPERTSSRAAGPGSMSALPASRTTPTGTQRSGGARKPTLSQEEREVAIALNPGLSEADAIVKYAEHKDFMAKRNPQHFQTRH